MTSIDVYASIISNKWILKLIHNNELISLEGTVSEDLDNPLRVQLHSFLEILQFLRNWISNHTFIIYINTDYIINCTEKWIPVWITKGFRIGHTNKLRPHSDLLVKIQAFQRCLSFKTIQHYENFNNYKLFLS